MISEEQFKLIRCQNNSYYQDKWTTIYHGDNRIDLKKIPDESIDLIVTDPNYGLKFMGKKWDVDVPAVETWIECFRVLKPGAFAFIMSSPRQDVLSEMIVRIRQAGFDTNFSSIYWTYAQGMPKAMNMSKAVMKLFGDEGEVIGIKNNTYDGSVRNPEKHKSPAELSNIGKWGLTKTPHGMPEIRPTDERALKLYGSYAGFQPKPALEVIIVAMKSLSEKTFIEQALKNRKGILWLDDCRIPLEEDSRLEKGGTYSERKCNNSTGMLGSGNVNTWTPQKGRFPANLLVSNDALNDGREHKSGDLTGQYGTVGSIYGVYDKSRPLYLKGNSVDSYSRYFDLDKWFEENLKKLPKDVQKTFPFLIIPKAAKSERNEFIEDIETEMGHNRFDTCATCGGTIFQNPDRPSACKCDVPVRQNNTVKGNFHPTAKPIMLMNYLITLGSREGDIILDPHVGGGTTCISARMLKRYSIGIDMDESYLRDIAVPKLKEMEKQKSIFDFESV